jgi:hypothetical protein
MTGATFTITTKETMSKGFPLPVQSENGTPTLIDLQRLFRHMITCTLSKFTMFHRLNWLFLVVPQVMWDIYVVDVQQEPNPHPPGNPGVTPNSGVGTPFNMAISRDTHAAEYIHWQKTKT